ncbi:hypothetical protein ANN_27546 [Periplaneta americana]|uniref:Endonuclease/exonuclease/phosphatase domain-containing protein n=1 Tax=Periplaneta americana TaxID=6978 RepID=A0ABQ8RW71_PERAM|nr:hypothetical protein ANN_27546 [Periplaneta americana]
MNWNVEGLITAFQYLNPNIWADKDVIVLTETFLTKDWCSQHHYTIHSLATQGQTGRPKGGITILLKSWLCPFHILHETECILAIKTIATVIVAAYFQPELEEQHLLNELSQAINKINKEETVILAGDLNCRIDITQDKAASVISYLENEGLSLINDRQEKTYICHNGSSTIDLIFSNMKRLHLTGRKH